MLILSDAKITIDRRGHIRVEGELTRYNARITDFLSELGITRAVIRLRGKRYSFRGIDPAIEQRVRNFLVNECPTRAR